MKAKTRAALAAAMFLLGAVAQAPVSAGTAAAAGEPAALPTCVESVLDADALGDRTGTLSRYAALPRECLQAVFMHCSSQAREALLDFGSAAVCSMGYEALLRTHFSGNFPALLAWWREQQGEAGVQ